MVREAIAAVSILVSQVSSLGLASDVQREQPTVRPRAQALSKGSMSLEGVRFWREGGATLVEGVVHLEGVSSWAASGDAIELAVRDASGTQIYSEAWTPAEWRSIARRNPGVPWSIAEPFRIGLNSGRYTVVARIGASGDVDSAGMEVEAFGSRPLLSDLLVSGSVRVLAEGEEPGLGEIRKGAYAIRRSGRVVVTPQHPDLWYYVELYAPEGDRLEADLAFSVFGEGEAAPIVKAQRSVEVTGGGGVRVARIDLAGLSAGRYRLVLEARTPGGDVRREAPFEMAEMQAEALAEVALRVSSPRGTESQVAERYFNPTVRGDSAVDAIVRALEIAPLSGSVPGYVRALDHDAKRRFLARYFADLDPDPATPTHELLDQYLQRLEFVIREYSEPNIGRPGVETDRGRIYLEYGPPDVKIERPLTKEKEIEAWRYTLKRDLRFIFLDESGLGHYRLIYTTHPNEPSLPDWMSLIGDDDLIREIFAY